MLLKIMIIINICYKCLGIIAIDVLSAFLRLSFKLRSKCSRKHQALKLPEAKQAFYQNQLDRVATLPKRQERRWIRIFQKRRKSAFSDHDIAKNSTMLLCKRLLTAGMYTAMFRKATEILQAEMSLKEITSIALNHCENLKVGSIFAHWYLCIVCLYWSMKYWKLKTELDCNDKAENNQHWCQICQYFL